MRLSELERILEYNIEKGASSHTLAQIRKDIEAKQKQVMDWHQVYLEEMRRGTGGGASESDDNARTSMKQLMKDNRAQATKLTEAERKEYLETLREWEEVNGRLERLSYRI